MAVDYREGGARGEVARGRAENTATNKGAASIRLVTGTTAISGVSVVTMEPAVEQTGQMCDTDGVLVRSAQ
jgi:hypothetical protein